MNSPFPGMDPYLEQYWPSVHTQLAVAAVQALNRKLPVDLTARPEERVQIATDEELTHVSTFIADTAVKENQFDETASSAVLVAPFTLVLDYEPGTERYVKILDKGDRLVTVIEFLSPSNKIGAGMTDYRKKRNELLDAGVHVVEVDLVRRGSWRALLEPHFCPAGALADYRGIIRLGKRRGTSYVYPWPIREVIKPIPIPLRSSDSLVTLDVQAMLSDIYIDGRYGNTIDYSIVPQPPLSKDNAEWVHELLSTHGIVQL